MDPIYHVFEKETGAFMGSGTVLFDDDTLGSTEVPCDYDPETEQAHWNGSTWMIETA